MSFCIDDPARRSHGTTGHAFPEREIARRFAEDIMREPDACSPELVVLAQQWSEAMRLLYLASDMDGAEGTKDHADAYEEIREFLGMPV